MRKAIDPRITAGLRGSGRGSKSPVQAGLLALAIVSWTACGDQEIQPEVAASASADTVAQGEQLAIAVVVRNFVLDSSAMGSAPEPGVGHYHVYLNEMNDDGFLDAGTGGEIIVTIPADTPVGDHEIHVTLVGNDHAHIGAPCAVLPLRVVAGEPAVSATASAQSMAAGQDVTLTVSVTNFTLDGSAMGGGNQAGVGHYHVYLNEMNEDGFLDAGTTAQITVTIPEETPAGQHELHVTLANNDHSHVGVDCAVLPIQVQ